MTETLVLVVDRDDDFGDKAKVETPVIGVERALEAAMALGTADPEDSDVNALFSAINVYKELKEDKKDVEIALVCGNAKVGHKSDMAVIEEITEVLDTVKPKNAILVGDGAEDEYVYPIISSRVPINSVKKVYVKQTPGLEGALYIFSKMISDPYKRKRFLAPIGFILCAIAMIFLIVDISGYTSTNSRDYIFQLSGPLVVLLLGVLLLMYSYNTISNLSDMFSDWNERLHKSNITILFTTLAIAMLAFGLFISIYSITDIWGANFWYVLIVFVQNLVWPLCMVVFISRLGKLIEGYAYGIERNWGAMTGVAMLFGIALIVQATTDFFLAYLGYSLPNTGTILVELIGGIVVMVLSSVLHTSLRKAEPDEASTESVA